MYCLEMKIVHFLSEKSRFWHFIKYFVYKCYTERYTAWFINKGYINWIMKFRLVLNIQGLPSQRATSNSSILAYLNVIKTISLIISCTKHLHNSFCIHFDAFWCILMHSYYLEQNMLFLPGKSSILPIFIK